MIVDFSRFTCGPCLKEISYLNQFVESLKGKYNFEIVSFSDEDTVIMNKILSNPMVKERIFKNKTVEYSYEVVTGAKQLFDTYKIFAYPTHLLLDKDGIIRKIILGVPTDEKTREFTLIETFTTELNSLGMNKK